MIIGLLVGLEERDSVSHNQLIRRVGFFVGWGEGRLARARLVRCYRAVPVNDNVVVGERSVACEAKVEDAGSQP